MATNNAHPIAAAINREATRLIRIGIDREAALLRAIGIVESQREAVRVAIENSTTKGKPRYAA